MSTVVKDLGAVSAYAYAVEKGYTGTEAEFAELMADYAEVGQRAEDAANSALESKTAAQTAAQTATTKAGEAQTSAQTASGKASEASQSATTASQKATEATQSASQASGYAQTAETAKTDAQTAKTQAETARDNAVTAKTAAETAQGKAEDAQAAAESVAESIPSDYSQLSEDVSDLKSEVTALESDGVAPSAEQLLSKNTTADTVPYLFRQTGGNGADREYVDAIVGSTVAWNQLTNRSATTSAKNLTLTDNTDGTVTIDGTADSGGVIDAYENVTVIENHVYVVLPYQSKATTWNCFYVAINSAMSISAATIIKASETKTGKLATLRTDNGAVWDSVKCALSLIDLTAMFGTTIADYIYSLEQSTAGAGVAFFKSLFPNDYYPYNAGELKSVEGVSAHETVGFNQWDEEWEVGGYASSTGAAWDTNTRIRSKTTNYISVLPNTTYYVNMPSGTNMYLDIMFYNAGKTFIGNTSPKAGKTFTTPSDARFMRFATGVNYGTTYNHDICINLSDPAKNGEYEPYESHNYPLDSSLTLRGIPKLSDGKMYFDGDRYLPDGKVERRYGIRAYQSGDESLADAITDGTNTVYKLTTTTIEDATPYRQLQICDPNGTEGFVSTGIVPVGHETRYPENLRAKIEGLPWDFSSLIAPTEKTTTASRNYTTGNLLIMGNTLYKVTANIANGGTITPNTNVTATTLSEILSALAQ